MKPVVIDFAHPSLARALLRARWPAWLALLAALLLCVVTFWAVMDLAASQRALQARRDDAAHRARRVAVVAPTAGVTQDPVQVAAVNAMVTQLNLPWRDLQAGVSAAASPAVAVLALEPDARKRVLKISAEARNSEDMIRYIERLQQQPVFAAVMLSRHDLSQQEQGQQEQPPLRFEIDAAWVTP